MFKSMPCSRSTYANRTVGNVLYLCADDPPGPLVELVAAERVVLAAQRVDDGVVLEDEEGVQRGQAGVLAAPHVPARVLPVDHLGQKVLEPS